MSSLPVPDEVKDPAKTGTVEVARVWLEDGQTWVSLPAELTVEDAVESWGSILADVAATIVARIPHDQSPEWRRNTFSKLSASFHDHLKVRI